MSEQNTGFTPIDNDLFSDENIEVYDFEDMPAEPISGGGRFSDEPAPEPVKAGPTAKQTSKMMVTLYNSVLSRIAAFWANDGRPSKDYSLEDDEKRELETAGEAYFETTKAEISPGWILLVSLLIISFSVIARANKNRKAAIEAREQLAQAKKAADQKASEAAARRIAAAAEIDAAVIQAAPESYGPRVEWRAPVPFTGEPVKTDGKKPAKAVKVRKKFQFDAEGFYLYGNSTNDAAGRDYRDTNKPDSWAKAPDKIITYTEERKAAGATQTDINKEIFELGLWK